MGPPASADRPDERQTAARAAEFQAAHYILPLHTAKPAIHPHSAAQDRHVNPSVLYLTGIFFSSDFHFIS
jgi:hypothetical protein